MNKKYHKVDFRELEYIEVKRDLPLRIKLDDNIYLVTRLQIADNLIKFNTDKNIIMQRLDKLNEMDSNVLEVSNAKVECYRLLIDLIYEVSKSEKKMSDKKWYRYLHNLFMNDIPYMIDIFTKILDYNSGLKKKTLNLQNFEIFKSSASGMMIGEQQLSDLIITDPITGEKSFKH